MSPNSCESSAADESPVRARVTLAALVIAWLLFLQGAWNLDAYNPPGPPPGSRTDLDLYATIVERVSQGDSYYDVAQRELRANGYPTRSIFHWRPPLYAWWLGSRFGHAFARLILIGLVLLTTWVCARQWMEHCGLIGAAVGVPALVGSLAWSFGGLTFVYSELWAGPLILLSACAFRARHRAVGIACGLIALFFRELSLPYVLVCLGVASWERRRLEVAAWTAGLFGFALYLGFHALQIEARLTPMDVASDVGWIRFGGTRFLLTITRANVFLMDLPSWVSALYLPLAVLGLCRPLDADDLRVSLTTIAYVAAFAVVGNPFNGYWGYINAPLLAWGLANAPRTLANLLREASPFDGPVPASHASVHLR